MKTLPSRIIVLLAALGCACSSDPAEPSSSSGWGVAGNNPAVLVVGQAYNPNAQYLTYVGVFPEVPTGDVGFKNFYEFGNANVSVHGGRVFVEENGVVQGFTVNQALELVKGPRVSWSDLGIASANAISTVFISATRAYTFAPQLGVIVVWNPETMSRTGVISLQFPARPEGMDTWAIDGKLVGDKVIWNVFSGNERSAEVHPAVVLAIADANGDAAPTFVEDSRCLPGGPSFLDDNGDYYVNGDGWFGYYYAYGKVPNARTCTLRVKAGTTTFDPEYLLDYKAVTGTYVNTAWINVTGNQFITYAWKPEAPFPAVPSDFWSGELRSLLVDRGAGTSRPYPDIQRYTDIDGRTRIVDGVSYFQVSESGYVEGGNTDVVELHPDGIRKKFHLTSGFLLELKRLR